LCVLLLLQQLLNLLWRKQHCLFELHLRMDRNRQYMHT
jgi:hypothetical protein